MVAVASCMCHVGDLRRLEAVRRAGYYHRIRYHDIFNFFIHVTAGSLVNMCDKGYKYTSKYSRSGSCGDIFDNRHGGLRRSEMLINRDG